MTPPAEVSVVVATRNRARRVRGLLRSLAGQTLDPGRYELIVVDDGSTDGTDQVLSAESTAVGAQVSILSGLGRGPAAARNLGWRVARAPLVAFIDDDCEATPTWLVQILAAAAEHPWAIVQGPTTPIPRELELIGPFTRTKRIVEPSPWFQTCNIAYPREVLERLDGFDESFPGAQGEDVDLGWRARELGVELRWRDGARVHHAVDDVGPVGFLRGALRSAGAVTIFRRHPQLRSTALRWGVVRNPRGPWLALAAAGLLLGRRSPVLGALLALPYARRVAGICRMQRASLLLAPYYALWDLVFLYTALRESMRHRVLVL